MHSRWWRSIGIEVWWTYNYDDGKNIGHELTISPPHPPINDDCSWCCSSFVITHCSSCPWWNAREDFPDGAGPSLLHYGPCLHLLPDSSRRRSDRQKSSCVFPVDIWILLHYNDNDPQQWWQPHSCIIRQHYSLFDHHPISSFFHRCRYGTTDEVPGRIPHPTLPMQSCYPFPAHSESATFIYRYS